MERLAKKVLLIGWDGADWKIINKLMDEGLMPATEYLVNNGVMGNLATLEPPFSPMLWTSIATGMRADKHGILGFSEPTPDHHGVRPVSSLSRKVKAVWNIFNQSGLKSHVVGWWPSHPAEPIDGIMISNHYQQPNVEPNKWGMMRGNVHPEELTGLFAHLRVHPLELSHEHLLPFVPKAPEVDQEKDKRLYQVAKNIAECSSLQAAASWIMENKEWDFMAVYHDTPDHFSHGFMNYHPPKMRGVSDEDFELYKGVITSAYRYHDMMLGNLLQMAGDDTTVMLISDHGFHSDHLRPAFIPNEPAGPAYQHRHHGIFCMKGPNIRRDETIFGANLLDIAPTLLTLFGLPIGKDMDGTPLVNCFDQELELDQIDTWEDVEGKAGMHSDEMREDPYESQESLKQLVELGYIEDPGDNVHVAVERTIREANYNLARVYVGSGRHAKAIPLLETLDKEKPGEWRFARRLIVCYLETKEIEKAKNLIQTTETLLRETVLGEEKIAKLQKEISDLQKQEDSDKKEVEKAVAKFRETQKENNNKKNALLNIELIKGDALIKEGKPQLALEQYKKVEAQNPNAKQINTQIGEAYNKLNQHKDAIKAFEKVLEIDEHNHNVFLGLAIAYFKLDEYEEAAEAALSVMELSYYQPQAHYYLALCLQKLQKFEQAAQAFEVCLTILPNFGTARNKLIELYEKDLNQIEKAEEHKKFFKQKEIEITANSEPQKQEVEKHVPIKPVSSESGLQATEKNVPSQEEPIIIVSGLPRSGTSMMMQMLEKGGLNILTDNKRKADSSNPKGYYEYEAVKRMARDNSWLPEAKGKVVKIISQLLFNLPPRFNYKIIFMERDIQEVLLSQQKMLIAQGKKTKTTYNMALENSFEKNIEKVKSWAKKQHNANILFVSHRETIENPMETAQSVNNFLGGTFDNEILASVIDKNLYRERS